MAEAKTRIKNMEKEEVKIFYPESPAAWRSWLEQNHQSGDAVLVVS
jgi:uncharacterized NAD(P)/FAD-binding protein YdhS